MAENVVKKLFDEDTKVYDAKHILNTSEKIINKSIIDSIEKNGITSEMLDTLGLPVYKYRTQITIHGIFPEGSDVRVGGYRNVIKNKNNSLGVRYTAIDRKKKDELYRLICFVEPKYWHIENSSTAFCLTHSEHIASEEQYIKLKEKAQQISNSLKGRVYANVFSNVIKTWMGLYGQIIVNIFALYEKDVKKAFHSICPNYERTLVDAKAEYEQWVIDEKERRRLENEKRDKEYRERKKRDAQERERNLAEITKKIEAFASEHGFKRYDEFDCRNKTCYYISLINPIYGTSYSKKFIKAIGKNAIRNEIKLNEELKPIYDVENRVKGTVLKNVWVKVIG